MKKRYPLCDFSSLPDYLRDNEFIVRHYRANWPLKQTLWSIFKIHNETGNIWTHLLGFVLFLSLTIYTAMKLPTVIEIPPLPHLHIPDAWLNATDTLQTHLHHMAHPDLSHFKEALKSMELPNLHTVFNSLPHVELSGISSSIYDAMPAMPHMLTAVRSRLPDLEVSKLQALLPHVELPNLPQIQAALHWYYECIYRYASSALDSNAMTMTTSWWNEQALMSNCSLPAASKLLVSPPALRAPITRWPFFLFLSGAMLCLLSSCTCHLLGCHSEEVSNIIWRFDYVGIAALICTSFFPTVYYAFLCQPRMQFFYLSAISLMGVLTVAVSLLPVFQSTKFRTFRASLFFGLGASGVVPCLHKLVLYWGNPVVVTTTGYEFLMGALYGLGAIFYATQIPERWLPGRFDIAGHSHQIFHLLVIAGAFTHYQAGRLYLQWRDVHACT